MMRCVITSTWIVGDNIKKGQEGDNIKKGQGTWRKGIPGLAELTPLAIPSLQIMSIIIIILLFDDMQLIFGTAQLTPW